MESADVVYADTASVSRGEHQGVADVEGGSARWSRKGQAGDDAHDAAIELGAASGAGLDASPLHRAAAHDVERHHELAPDVGIALQLDFVAVLQLLDVGADHPVDDLPRIGGADRGSCHAHGGR